MRRLWFTALIFCGIAVTNAAAQEAAAPELDRSGPIRVRTSLVNLPLIVSDIAGRRVTDLTSGEISVTVGDQPRIIDFFADTDEPVTFAFLIDTSGSTREVRAKIAFAARKFVRHMAAADRGSVTRFDDAVRVICPLTDDKKLITLAIDRLPTYNGGRPVMNEALISVLDEQFAGVKGRKAVILLTDAAAVDRASNLDLMAKIESSDVVIYPVVYETFPAERLIGLSTASDQTTENKPPRRLERGELIKHPPFDHMAAIANASGGRLLFADGDDFEKAFRSIADELRRQYVVGFYIDADDGTLRQPISVSVGRPDIIVRTKQNIIIRPAAEN